VLVNEGVGHDYESRRCTGLPLPRHVDMLIAAAKPQGSLEYFLVVTQVETHVDKLGMGWRLLAPNLFLSGAIFLFSPNVRCFTMREVAGCCSRGSAGWESIFKVNLSLFSTTVIEDSCFSLEGELKARTCCR